MVIVMELLILSFSSVIPICSKLYVVLLLGFGRSLLLHVPPFKASLPFWHGQAKVGTPCTRAQTKTHINDNKNDTD